MTTVKKNALIATVALMVIAACLTLVGCGSYDSKGLNIDELSFFADGGGTLAAKGHVAKDGA